MIEFFYEEIASDLEDIAKHGQLFLHSSALDRMLGAADELRHRKKSDSARWIVSEDRPIITAESLGESELGDHVSWNVIGHVCFAWDIHRTTAGKKATFGIVNATTRIKFLEHLEDDVDGRTLAEWRFEIGSRDHPGCLVHSQVEWPVSREEGGGKFEVPRLPSIILTPSECIDFVLGELFQRRWPEQSSRQNEAKQWKSNHRGRMKKYLDAQLSIVNQVDVNVMSPWQNLKSWKPEMLLNR